MNNILSNYLSQIQYNKICKYWKIIEKYSYKVEHFNYNNYKSYEKYSDDEERSKECIENNKRIDDNLQKIKNKLNYYEQEYEKYINTIGFELNNRNYDEHLFNLLNNGMILD